MGVGGAPAVRAGRVDLVEFGSGSRPVEVGRVGRRASVLRVLKRFHDLGGTDTAGAVTRHHREHGRVVVVTDEQAQGTPPGREPPGRDALGAVPEHVRGGGEAAGRPWGEGARLRGRAGYWRQVLGRGVFAFRSSACEERREECGI
ncbi:hypothetical protein [Streptomyces sp. NPDC006638]|uniref:hypothetical protein n=1 Tax=Streptomyces sp. NPDC006638 TaxID=3157183 RepID=UPI0033AA2951